MFQCLVKIERVESCLLNQEGLVHIICLPFFACYKYFFFYNKSFIKSNRNIKLIFLSLIKDWFLQQKFYQLKQKH